LVQRAGAESEKSKERAQSFDRPKTGMKP